MMTTAEEMTDSQLEKLKKTRTDRAGQGFARASA